MLAFLGSPALLCSPGAQPDREELPEGERERVHRAYWKALEEAKDERDGTQRLAALVTELEQAGYASAARCLADNLDAFVVHLRYPLRHRKRWRSTNLLERTLGEVKRRTKVIGRFPGEESNAIENIHAPRARIEALVAEKTMPENRSEQEIAGYRDVLALIHANRADIPFEPRYVEQLHGTLHRYVGDRDAGHWKKLGNEAEEERPDGTKVVRFMPVSAALTPQAMEDLHAEFRRALDAGIYEPLLLCAAYVLDFTVIHPFRDGNGRMSRLITLWLLYVIGHDVGRYISLEKLIDTSRETYYEALRLSTDGWHAAEHDLAPWTGYFLGILLAAYKDFENRAGTLGGRGSKRTLIVTFIDSLLTDEFTVAAIRENAPGVSDGWISQVLGELKREGIVESLGTGRSARWKRLSRQA